MKMLNRRLVCFLSLVLATRQSCHALQSSSALTKAHRSPLFASLSTLGGEDNHNTQPQNFSPTTTSKDKTSPKKLLWRRFVSAAAGPIKTGASLLRPSSHTALSAAHHHHQLQPALTGTGGNVHSSSHATATDTAIATAMVQMMQKENQELNSRVEKLEQENRLLLETVQGLEVDNEQLLYESSVARQNSLVLETFEGEGEEWCDELNDGACPVEPSVSFGQALRDRAVWLVGLLLLQSFSGIILARNESLIANHPFIVYFLTMLVGAGGNAGNQASVRVIRGLALGTLNPATQTQFLTRELKMAVSLSTLLTLTGFVRAAAFSTPFPETVAITLALFMIVFSSICLGAVLPLGLKRVGVDPAHSSTSIQVIMDILGVILAVGVSSILLDSPLGLFLMSKLAP